MMSQTIIRGALVSLSESPKLLFRLTVEGAAGVEEDAEVVFTEEVVLLLPMD